MKLAFEPHKINRSQLHPIGSHVIVHEMKFDHRITNSGILLLNDDMKSAGIRPRWAQVYAVGPEQTDIEVGQYVLISHGRWTRGINIADEEGEKTIRRVDPNDILMVSDEQMDDETMSTQVY